MRNEDTFAIEWARCGARGEWKWMKISKKWCRWQAKLCIKDEEEDYWSLWGLRDTGHVGSFVFYISSRRASFIDCRCTSVMPLSSSSSMMPPRPTHPARSLIPRANNYLLERNESHGPSRFPHPLLLHWCQSSNIDSSFWQLTNIKFKFLPRKYWYNDTINEKRDVRATTTYLMTMIIHFFFFLSDTAKGKRGIETNRLCLRGSKCRASPPVWKLDNVTTGVRGCCI